MIRTIDCITKYGNPSAKSKYLIMYQMPLSLQLPHLPKTIFCNVDFVEPYEKAIKNLIDAGCENEIKTFDGCFNIRKARGTSVWSLHSWGVAIDLNAFENQMFTKGKFSRKFVDCWIKAGFDWGGYWDKRKDPMHFQLTSINK